MVWNAGLSILVQPLCWVDFVPLKRASVWIDSSELNILTEVISAVIAEEAVFAGNARLNSDAIA